MKINRETIRTLGPQIEQQLAGLAAEHGIRIVYDGGSYDHSGKHGTIKLTVATIGEDGVANDPERTAFEQHAAAYGFESSDLGRTFDFMGETYRIVGLRPRASKRPIACERVDGKRFVFPPALVHSALRQ